MWYKDFKSLVFLCYFFKDMSNSQCEFGYKEHLCSAKISQQRCNILKRASFLCVCVHDNYHMTFLPKMSVLHDHFVIFTSTLFYFWDYNCVSFFPLVPLNPSIYPSLFSFKFIASFVFLIVIALESVYHKYIFIYKHLNVYNYLK